MKATPILLTALIGVSTGLIGCFLGIESCPKDQSLGLLKLTNPTFSPYQGNETLTFASQSGNQLILSNFEYGTLSNQQRLIISIACSKGEWNRQDIYYDSPYTFIPFRQSKTDYRHTISYSFGIQNLRVNPSVSDTVLAEHLSIYNNFTQRTTELRVLVSDRGNLARFDPVKSQYPSLVNYRIITDTLLGSQSYKDVYCSKGAPTLFYNQQYGILAFKDEQQWWYRVP